MKNVENWKLIWIWERKWSTLFPSVGGRETHLVACTLSVYRRLFIVWLGNIGAVVIVNDIITPAPRSQIIRQKKEIIVRLLLKNHIHMPLILMATLSGNRSQQSECIVYGEGQSRQPHTENNRSCIEMDSTATTIPTKFHGRWSMNLSLWIPIVNCYEKQTESASLALNSGLSCNLFQSRGISVADRHYWPKHTVFLTDAGSRRSSEYDLCQLRINLQVYCDRKARRPLLHLFYCTSPICVRE